MQYSGAFFFSASLIRYTHRMGVRMIDCIVIVNKHQAYIIFVGDRHPIGLSSDRDVRELIYWFFDFHRNIKNDDITEKIYIDTREVA